MQRIQADDIIMEKIISYRSESLTPWVIHITNLGAAYSYAIIIPVAALILYFLKKRWIVSIEAAIVLISASFLNSFLKSWISRPRPDTDLHLVEATSFSYPSGHAMSAMAFYGFLVYLTFKFVRPAWLKTLLIIFFICLILAIGTSRVYLGVHYPSDVVAGFAAGATWLILCILLLSIGRYRGVLRAYKKW
jgi:undecaprenyl-diphosphatase